MKQCLFLLAACLMLVGCQPPMTQQQPVEQQAQQAPPTVIIDRRPIIVERPAYRCTFFNHCGRYSCDTCRYYGWYRCTPHDHCGCCPHCRACGWGFIGIRIGPRFGIGIGCP